MEKLVPPYLDSFLISKALFSIAQPSLCCILLPQTFKTLVRMRNVIESSQNSSLLDKNIIATIKLILNLIVNY